MLWDEQVNNFNKKAFVGVNNMKQTAGLDWCWMITEIKLVETMKQGLWMSIVFALFALLCATQNFIIASLASLTIGLIIINVLALVPINGWQLGSGESVGVVVCIGFAVDYVVHLGGHYVHSKYRDRENRIREALKEMGISILSGSITTMMSVLILFAAVILIFTKFAIFVIATIIFSTFYSLCFFIACCHVIGPNGDFGNIGIVFRCCFNCCKKPRRQNVKRGSTDRMPKY